jgi:hypothetical protein
MLKNPLFCRLRKPDRSGRIPQAAHTQSWNDERIALLAGGLMRGVGVGTGRHGANGCRAAPQPVSGESGQM